MCFGGSDFFQYPLILLLKNRICQRCFGCQRGMLPPFFLVHLQLLQNASIKESQRQDTVFERGEC